MRTHIKTAIDEMISVNELSASLMSAIEPLIIPAMSFRIKSAVLPKILRTVALKAIGFIEYLTLLDVYSNRLIRREYAAGGRHSCPAIP